MVDVIHHPTFVTKILLRMGVKASQARDGGSGNGKERQRAAEGGKEAAEGGREEQGTGTAA